MLINNYGAVQNGDYSTNNDKVIHNQPQQYQLLESVQDSSPLTQQIQLSENVQQTIEEQSQNLPSLVSQQEINGHHAENDQQVQLPSEHLNNNEFICV